MGKQVKFFDKNAWWFIVVINILFLLGIIFIASFVSASSFGYNDIPQGFKTITQNINTTQVIVNGTAVNASSFSTACSGTNKVSNVTYSNFTGLFTIICTTDETSAGGAEPLWSANFTLYNSSWSSINNATYNEAWLLATNGTFYKRITNEYNYTNKTLLSQFGNDLTFYVDNSHSYFNLTNFPNYANVYLNTSNQFSYFNLTNFPNYANVYLNTSNQFTYWNSTFATFNKTYADTLYATASQLANFYLNTTNQFSYYNSTSWNNPYTYWNSTFATFNKTYADTLYQPVGTYIDQTYGNATYYLKTNPFSFYNSTSWNNPYTYFNLTNFPNYANVYLNTTNQFGYINLTTLAGNETDAKWSGNYSTFLTHITWANAVNGTLATWGQAMNGTLFKRVDWDTNYSTNDPIWRSFSGANYTAFLSHITWDKVINGTVRLSTNNTFAGNVNINSAGNLNITAGNSTIFLGRIKLGIDSQNCAGLQSGEICRNSTAIYIKG